MFCFTGKVVFVYLQFIFHPLHVLSFQVHVRWRHRNTSDKLQVCSSRQLSCQIQERLLKVVIALCADIIVLLTQGFKFKEYCYSLQDVVDGHFKILKNSVLNFCTHLNVFPSMKYNVLGFNLTVFDIHLVTAEYHWYVTAHPVQVPVPDWYISVRGGCRYIKHQYGAVSCSKRPKNVFVRVFNFFFIKTQIHWGRVWGAILAF